jgi:hypothetical protein
MSLPNRMQPLYYLKLHQGWDRSNCRAVGEPADGFESSRVEWVPLDTILALIGDGQISSGTTIAALLYTLAQDTPDNH